MEITFSIDDRIVERARERLSAMGRTVEQEICEHLVWLSGSEDLERDLEFFERTSGLGDSKGWKFNREELYEERLRWPRE